MIANKQGLIASCKPVGLTLAAAAVLLGASSAWADPEFRSSPLGVYVGVAGGFAPSHRTCEGVSKDSCDRLSFGHKVYGGWNMTNDVALEVNYLYFNGVNRDYDTADNAAHSRERVSSRAMTLGIDWHIDLINYVTNHIRVGIARNQKIQQNYLRTGGEETAVDYKTVPYLGAALSYPVNDYLRFDAAFDYIFADHDSRHLLSLGAVMSF